MSDPVDEKRTKTIQEAMVQNAEFFGFDLCDRIDIGGRLKFTDTKIGKFLTHRSYEEFGVCHKHQLSHDS